MQVGNRWTYHHIDKNHVWTVEISGKKMIGGTQYFIFRRSYQNSSYADSSFYRLAPDGKIIMNHLSRDYIWLDVSRRAGESWKSCGVLTAVISKHEPQVKVPAGVFNNCMEVHFRIPDTADSERIFMYAPGVGLIVYKTADGVSKLISAEIDGTYLGVNEDFMTSKFVE